MSYLINLVLYIQCAFQKLQLQYIHSLQFEQRRLIEKLKNRLGSSFIYIDKLISETNKASYFLGHVKIEFNSEPVISEGKITIENNVISHMSF
jgi:sorbitol-specific phosphotransferase system component IIA